MTCGKSADTIPKKSNGNSILEQSEEVKKKKIMTIMLSSSARAAKEGKRFVKLQRFKVSIPQI